MKLGLEQLVFVVTLISCARRRLDAEQERCLRPRALPQEAVLAKDREVADAFAVAPVDDFGHHHFLMHSTGLMLLAVLCSTLGLSMGVVMCPLADADSDHIRQLERDHQPIGQSVGESSRRAFERSKAMHVLVAGGAGLQHGVAQLLERDALEGEPSVGVALVQCRCRNGDDGSGSARTGNAGRMVRKGGR